MKNVSKSIIIAIVLLLLITIGGAIGWYWMASQIDDLQRQQDEVTNSVSTLEKKIYSPEEDNLARLEGNDKKVRELLDNFKGELEARDKVFDGIRISAADGQRGLEPDEWKKMFGSIRDRLTKEAADAKIKIPQDYDFAFSAYRLSLPANNLTLPLGVQLLGVDRLSEIMIGARVKSIEFIKRAGVEAREGKDSTDVLSASILSGPGGLYKVYPFELAFTCTSAAFSEIVNKIEASDLVFIIRAISARNEKQEMQLASQVKAANANNNSNDDTATDNSGKINKLVIPVLGRELVQVNIRVDLLYLTLQAPMEKASAQNTKSPQRSRP
jgi:hypothetical protein